MSQLSLKIAELSPEKRELLFQRLKQQQKSTLANQSNDTRSKEIQRDVEIFPLTEVQEAFWSDRAGWMRPEHIGTNVYTELALCTPEPDFVEKLQDAIQQLVARHEVLRLVITADGKQKILSQVPPYTVSAVDLRGKSSVEIQETLQTARAELCYKAGEISTWPLFECICYRLDHYSLRLLFRMDALLVDGTSRVKFLWELFDLMSPGQPGLPPLEFTYKDYLVSWLTRRTESTYRRAQRYWEEHLQTLPPAPRGLFHEDVSPDRKPAFVERIVMLLDAAHWQRVKQIVSKKGLTPSIVVIAAFMEVLAQWTAEQPFTISLMGTYTPPFHPQIENVLGNFNVIYLLSRGEGRMQFEVLARQLQAELLSHLEHAYYTGFEVLRQMRRIYHLGQQPIMPILFNSLLEYAYPAFWPLEGEDGQLMPMGAYQVEELHSGLYAPHILLLPGIVQNTRGDLLCKWKFVPGSLQENDSNMMIGDFIAALQHLATEEEGWSRSLIQAPRQFQAREDAQFLTDRDAATDQIEDMLCSMWKDLLCVQSVSPTDDFFAKGGDSFQAACLLAQIKERFQRGIPASQFFKYPTVSHMAYLLRAGEGTIPSLSEK